MSLIETRYEHILLDESQVPVLAGTTMKVSELVAEHLAYGWSPAELHFQHPFLTLGQIHSAMAYYWDHREALEQDIEARLAHAEKLQRNTPSPTILSRLKGGIGR
ncbi:MAG: DUF433 domain-containing protein [Candidatus Latescibacteria bacterium]|nr:DUF433 domain-containing protein [Candidatus Latescibacterota bacterium]